jgi:putative aldouronate transport system permease protein
VTTESGTAGRVSRPAEKPAKPARRGTSVWTRVRQEKWMYLFILPGFVYFVVFRYLPLLGNVVAFQDYSPYLGFLSSEWVGFQNFIDLFNNPDVAQALANTVIINGLQLIFFFPHHQSRHQAGDPVDRLSAVLHRLGRARQRLAVGARR